MTPSKRQFRGARGSLLRLLARLDIPPLDRPVIAPRGQRLAVRAEGQGGYKVRVPPEGGPLVPRLHLPQLDGFVVAPGGQGLAVRAERHRPHDTRVSLEGGLLL